MSFDTLNACPLCGNENVVVVEYIDVAFAHCQQCDATGPNVQGDPGNMSFAAYLARKKWNEAKR